MHIKYYVTEKYAFILYKDIFMQVKYFPSTTFTPQLSFTLSFRV